MAYFPKCIDSVRIVVGISILPGKRWLVQFGDGTTLEVHPNDRPVPEMGAYYVRYRIRGETDEGGGYGCFLSEDVAEALLHGEV